LRAVAALRAGETQIAWRDVETLNRLQAALQKEPLLISLLVRATILAKLEQPVWEGVVDRRWSAAQLQQLQDLLGRIDLTRDYLWAVRGERAYARAFYKFEQARRAPTLAKIHALAPFETLPRALEWAFLLLPLNATFDQNEAMHERWMQSLALPLVDSRKGIVLPRNADQIERTIKGSASTPYNVLAKLSLKILPPIARRTGAALAVAREAQVACAIARFCLTNERSPATLAELVPRFLREIPSDPINGGALLYLIEPNEKYRLYSVGWNQVDDGGKIALRNSTRRDDEKGDWVWLSAPR
jgi:hypothetical protein